jgi:multidrug efflux pump subunit AcrA (membrane-fusion protein)
VLWRVGGRTLKYTATIERVGAEISAASGGVEAFARLETRGTETPLRPGAFVEVRLPDTRYTQVALLPETALFDGDTIYAIVDGRLEPRKVEVATRTPEGILVSGNLAEGDQVLVTRFNEAGPGVRVDIQSGGA